MTGIKVRRHHPLTETVYLLSVVFLTFFSMRPLICAVSFIGLLSFTPFLRLPSKFHREIWFALFLGASVCLLNPLFSQKGSTTLFYIYTLRVTLESLLYGALLGATLVSAIFWFKILSCSLTSDRVRELLGRRFPSLALAFSMSLSLIPQMRQKYGDIICGLKVSGMYNDRDFLSRIKTYLKAFSMLITQSLESGVRRAQAMKAKGYGGNRQSFYSEFHFGKGDLALIILIFLLDTAITACLVLGGDFRFYPLIDISKTNIFIYLGGVLFLLLCLLPSFENTFRAVRAKIIFKKGKKNTVSSHGTVKN